MVCSMPGLPVHHQLLEPVQTHIHWVGDVIQPSNPLSSPSPPALNLSSIRVFSNESVLCTRWQKYWSFSISPFNEYSGLISFRIDGLIFLQSKGISRFLSNTTVQKHRFDPWVRNIPWRRAWQLTPVFLPGESHGERNPMGYSPCGRTELDIIEAT